MIRPSSYVKIGEDRVVKLPEIHQRSGTCVVCSLSHHDTTFLLFSDITSHKKWCPSSFWVMLHPFFLMWQKFCSLHRPSVLFAWLASWRRCGWCAFFALWLWSFKMGRIWGRKRSKVNLWPPKAFLSCDPNLVTYLKLQWRLWSENFRWILDGDFSGRFSMKLPWTHVSAACFGELPPEFRGLQITPGQRWTCSSSSLCGWIIEYLAAIKQTNLLGIFYDWYIYIYYDSCIFMHLQCEKSSWIDIRIHTSLMAEIREKTHSPVEGVR